jgi:hypothetical protein
MALLEVHVARVFFSGSIARSTTGRTDALRADGGLEATLPESR